MRAFFLPAFAYFFLHVNDFLCVGIVCDNMKRSVTLYSNENGSPYTRIFIHLLRTVLSTMHFKYYGTVDISFLRQVNRHHVR